jgi:uncharacterized protein YqfB (UPF0267 family)
MHKRESAEYSSGRRSSSAAKKRTSRNVLSVIAVPEKSEKLSESQEQVDVLVQQKDNAVANDNVNLEPAQPEIKIETLNEKTIETENLSISKIQITLQGADDSVIEIFDSPNNENPSENTTFSPIVDRSIVDKRPVIGDDIEPPRHLDPSRVLKKPLQAITSTPLRIVSELSPAASIKKIDWNSDRSILPLNSCLKSHRKRSLSVADAETMKSHKLKNKVIFHSPANSSVLIESIDEKMLKSFMQEKENSILMTSLVHRKRSLSECREVRRQPEVSTDKASNSNFKIARAKVPNFSAIHRKQFEKMESVVEHDIRKKERAKILTTPKKAADFGNISKSKGAKN